MATPGEVSLGEHKQITTMFVDIVGSLQRAEELGSEAWGAALDAFCRVAGEAVEELGGVVHQFTGDGLMAIFGAPMAVEDHARRACLAALRVHALLARDPELPTVRVGLHSGDAVVSAPRAGSAGDLPVVSVVGHAVGIARRMEGLAEESTTLLSAATADLVRGEFELVDHGEREVRGLRDPVRVYELVAVTETYDPLAALTAHGVLSPYLGRDGELARLGAAFGQCRGGSVVTGLLSGAPGVGKSRLVLEFLDTIRGSADVVWARAVPHGRQTPYLVLLELIRRIFAITAAEPAEVVRARVEKTLRALDPALVPDVPVVNSFLGIGEESESVDPEARARRLLQVFTRCLELGARRRPVVVVIDDVQWADAASAEFIATLMQGLPASALMLLATARPGYDGPLAPVARDLLLPLHPLSADVSAELARGLLGADPSTAEIARQVTTRAAGNPFFCEELVRSLVDGGHLEGERGDYRASGSRPPPLPPTIQASLAARLDRLDYRERQVLRDVAAIEREATLAVLEALRAVDPRQPVAGSLRSLMTGGLLIEAVLHLGDEPRYTVAHPLIGEVAMAAMVADSRRQLHQEIAAALELLAGPAVEERAATLAHHHEAAGDDETAALWFARAAEWAGRTSPLEAVRNWRAMRDVTERMPAGKMRDDLALMSRLGLLAVGWREHISDAEVERSYAEIVHAVTDTPDEEFMLAVADAAYAANLQFCGRVAEAVPVARRNLARVEALADRNLHLLVAPTFWYAAVTVGDFASAFHASDRALEVAAGDTSLGTTMTGAPDSPYAMCLWGRGYSAGFLGDWPRADTDIRAAVALAIEEGNGETVPYASAGLAFLSAMIGDVETCVADAAVAHESAQRGGNTMALNAACLARIWAGLATGRHAEVTDAAHDMLRIGESRGLGVELHLFAYYGLAEVALARGDHVAALVLARRAVELAQQPSRLWGELMAQLVLAKAQLATAAALEDPAGLGAARAEVLAADEALAAAEGVRDATDIRICDPVLLRTRALRAAAGGDLLAAARCHREEMRAIASLRDGTAAAGFDRTVRLA